MTWNMLQYVILCSEALLAEGTGGLSAARVFHVLIGIITPLNIICNIFFLLYLHITEGTGIILVIWRWVKVLWSTRALRVLGTRRDLPTQQIFFCVKPDEQTFIISNHFTRLVSKGFWATRRYLYRWKNTVSSRHFLMQMDLMQKRLK